MMLDNKPPPRGRTWPGALLGAVLCAVGGGTAWGASTGDADAPRATESQPGITLSGLNTWTIGSTPVTESIPVDKLAHAALPKLIVDAGVVEIGAITDEPPFVFVQDGKLQGVDIDMISALAQALGIQIRLHKTSFDAMIPGLQANRFDVIMGDLTDTAAREKVVDFVDYLQNAQTVIVRKGETRDFSTPLKLCGFSAAAPKGSLSDRIATELSEICTDKGLKSIDLKTFPGSAPVFLALDLGRVDVSPITYAIATYVVKLHPEKYELTDNLFYKSYKGAAVLRGHDDLRDALAKGFQSVIDSPTYEKILTRWGLERIKADKVYVNSPGEPLKESIR